MEDTGLVCELSWLCIAATVIQRSWQLQHSPAHHHSDAGEDEGAASQSSDSMRKLFGGDVFKGMHSFVVIAVKDPNHRGKPRR